jgi:hypothetical protein
MLKRIEVHAERPGENDRILGDDGQPGSEIKESEATDVLPVDANGSGGCLDDPEEGESQGRLSRPCPTHHAELITQKRLYAIISRWSHNTFSPDWISQETPFRTRSRPGRYLT